MDNNCTSKQNGGHANLCRPLLLLFLAGLQPILSSHREHSDQLKVEVFGPDYVTVGVPSSVECGSNCPACTYSMSLDGQKGQGQGNVLAFTVSTWVEALTVTCTIITHDTVTATTQKRLQVLAGPSDVSISGPNLMNPTVSHTYSCSAYCRPSCIYSWQTDRGPWIRGQGNVMSVTPQELDNAKVLICKATNSVSGLFVTATRNISVMFGPSEVQIKGPDVIEMAEQYRFVCTAECHPSCRYLSSVDGQTVKGNVVELSVDHPLKSVTIRCEAQNTASRKTASALKTVHVKDRSVAVRPEGTTVVLLSAFILSAAFTL